MGNIKKEISIYIKELEQKAIKVVFCPEFLPVIYHGQVCKLTAGAVVQNYLFANKMNSEHPLPLHKNHSFFSESIRQRAKQEINSKVGEVYGPKQMKKVFNYNNFQTISYRIEQKNVYENFLINALNQKFPVVVYFDVVVGKTLPTWGNPRISGGNFEHAVAVGGYYYAEDKLHLIVAQLGKFFDILFDDLYSSTSQLNKSKKPEHYQKYFPIPGEFNRKTWMEKEQINLVLDQTYGKSGIKRNVFSAITTLWPKSGERLSTPPLGEEGSFANTLTIINGDNQEPNLDYFREFMVTDEQNDSEMQLTFP